MRKILFLLLFFAMLQKLNAQTPLQVNPNTKYQEIEGWGGSLCWWANIAGGWSDAKINEICTWITSPNELNMNVFRFNIGGGDTPTHDHMRKDGGAMPGYKTSESGAYDWSRDANQRKILLKLKSLRSDIILEAFSNSPPYWMTNSGCASGNTDGSDNLKTDYYDDFADYLTDVVKHYKDTQGITFRTLDPFNEPFSNWWKANGGQEGCKFTQGVQPNMINALYDKLTSKDMLGYCNISAMDANNIDDTYRGLNRYPANILPKIGQINTHSYKGTLRADLATVAQNQGKRLWQSESGPLGIGGSGLPNYLGMCIRLITDLRDLKSVAWIDWQLMAENDPKWGLIPGDYTAQTYKKDKSYYFRMQCSRFIKKGYTIIYTSDSRTVAALNPASNELVLVVCNETTAATSYNIDLSLFGSMSGTAKAYRTSGSENCTALANINISNKAINYSAPAQSLTTFVIAVSMAPATGITDGTTYNIISKQSGQFFDVARGSSANGALIQTYTSTGGANQQWTAKSVGGGYYTLTAVHSGKNMDVSGASVADSAKLLQWTANNNAANQQFQLVNQVGDYFQIIAKNSGKCVQANGTNVQQFTCTGADNQSFRFATPGSARLAVSSINEELHHAETLSDEDLQVYPNPSQYSFVIKAKGSFKYVIYDQLGEEIENGSGHNSTTVGGLLRPSAYLLKVQEANGTHKFRVVKE